MTELYSRPALILTDDKHIETPLSRTLFTLQYRVDVAKTPSEAMQLAERTNYLIIVLADQPNRNIDSLSFFIKLKAKHPKYNKNVLFISDKTSNSLNAELDGRDLVHLNKPFEPAQLAFEIEALRGSGILTESRIENRYNWTGECKVNSDSEYIGKTMDISAQGIKLYYVGEKVEKDTTATVHIPDIGYDGKAKVQWSFQMGEKTLLGLDLETHINSTDLKKAIPFAP